MNSTQPMATVATPYPHAPHAVAVPIEGQVVASTSVQAVPIQAVPVVHVQPIQPVQAVPVMAAGVAVQGQPFPQPHMGFPQPHMGQPVVQGVFAQRGAVPESEQGAFKQGLCDCCNQCCCLFCAGWWCGPTMISQLFQIEVRPIHGTCDKYAKILWTILVFATLFDVLARVADLRVLGLVGFMAQIGFAIFSTWILVQVRRSIRYRYRIAAECCGDLEDCCCSFWCSCCTTIQIAHQLGITNQNFQLCAPTAGLALAV